MKNKKETYFNLELAQDGDETTDKVNDETIDESNDERERDLYDFIFDENTKTWYSKLKGTPDSFYKKVSKEKLDKFFDTKDDTVDPALDAAKDVVGDVDLNKDIGVSFQDKSSIVDDSEGHDDLSLNEINKRHLESANMFAGVGDTNIFDLIGAGIQVGKSFGKDQYYDPGKASDYKKYTFENTSDEDMYIDEDAFNKGKKQSEVFVTKDELAEQQIQNFLDDRHRRNPQKYAKVKDFDIEEYRETGDVDYRQGPFGLFESEGKQGDKS
jgi:hypothetical protein